MKLPLKITLPDDLAAVTAKKLAAHGLTLQACLEMLITRIANEEDLEPLHLFLRPR